jgi:hypothetical protein
MNSEKVTYEITDTYSKALKLSKEETAKLKQWETLEQMDWFAEVVQLTYGQSFGELALINDAKRAATIHCVEECYFAVIGRHDYEKVLKKIEWKRSQKAINFF